HCLVSEIVDNSTGINLLIKTTNTREERMFESLLNAHAMCVIESKSALDEVEKLVGILTNLTPQPRPSFLSRWNIAKWHLRLSNK
ncbi:hypothetical protein PMAYCL1PPCAC_27247, partial [Pristionchus mayeri]